MTAQTSAGQWAAYLRNATETRQAVAPITDTFPELSLSEALAIQQLGIDHRVARGERVTGGKLGLTSRAKQVAMGIAEPIIGWLTDAMLLPTDQPLSVKEHIHPRVEPEIVFVLERDLSGPGVSLIDALAATSVCCGLEVIDSRYAEFRFKLADVIADNASASRYCLGPLMRPSSRDDLSLIGCMLEVDGEIVSSASGAAVLGHPGEAVAMLANHLARDGRRLEAGSTVLSGGLVNAVPLAPGRHVTASFGRLGSVTITAVE